MKNIFQTIIFTVLITTATFAQGSMWTLNWDMGFPQGDTKEFIEDTSFRGVSLDGRYFIQDNISLGGSIGWQVLYQRLRDQPPIHIVNNGITGDISGTQFRYLNTLPILAKGHYYVETGKSKFYLGAGIGTIYAEQRIDVGMTSFIDDSWRFGLQPEVGYFLPFKYSDVGLNFTAKYLYGTSAGNADAISMFTLGIGIGWLNW